MKTTGEFIDYVHPQLDHEVTAISGHYVYTKEIRVPYNDREILYFVGYAVVDSSCCGVGGCVYALAAGFIHAWKYKNNKDGVPVSQIEPIRNQADREEIRRLIREKETVQTVSFI